MTYGDTRSIENLAAAGSNLKTEIIRSVRDPAAQASALAAVQQACKTAMDSVDGVTTMPRVAKVQ